MSVVLEVLTESVVNPATTVDSDSSPFTLAIGAPLIEEAAKGLFLLIMMTGRRRNELNSLTDCLVYAGLAAAGFAWIEDIFYIANAESLGASLVTAALRLVMAPFAHPLFTTFTGIGVYFALRHRNVLAKVGFILLGYAGAVLMHGLWNGSALFGFETYLGVYVVWMVPIFALAITLAVRSRRHEQTVVAAKLPGMVAAGVVAPNEAAWLGSIGSRKQAIDTAIAVRWPGRRQDSQELRGTGRRAGVRPGSHRPRLRRRSGVRPAERRGAGGVRGARGGSARPGGTGRLPRDGVFVN